jgi:hypothetical protein
MPGTVTVACKLPNGILMRVYAMEEYQEPVMGGGWKAVKRAVQTGSEVLINGMAVAFGKAPPHDLRSGFALTYGVDADLFSEWLKQNKDNDIVKGNKASNNQPYIFAFSKTPDAEAKAKELATLRSGLEPIDPKNMPSEFKGKIETAPRK